MVLILLCLLGIMVISLSAISIYSILREMKYVDYPVFVRRNVPSNLSIPVVLYHSVTYDQMKSDVKYLFAEKYNVLTLNEFVEIMKSNCCPSEKNILLTFDDALLNTYQIAAPVLEKYEMPSVCFVCPGLLKDGDCREQPSENSNLKLYGNQKSNELMNWSEIKRLQENGLIDFQSHTWDHSLIYVTDRILGFCDGSQYFWPYGKSVPIPSKQYEKGADFTWWQPRGKLGHPIYTIQSRMGPRPRFIESDEVRLACEKNVYENGGENYFKLPDAKERLFKVYKQAIDKWGPGEWEPEEQQYSAIFNSLSRSKSALEKRLGKKITSVCFPYNISSVFSCNLARKVGYELGFVGKVARPIEFATFSDDLLQIPRIPSSVGGVSLIDSLPSPHRQNIGKVIKKRIIKQILTK